MGSGKAFHRKACSSNVQGQKTARPPARDVALDWGPIAAGPGLRPGGRRSPQVPTLGRGCGLAPKCRLSAETELGGRPESETRDTLPRAAIVTGVGGGAERRRGRGGAWRDPNKPTCGPDRRGDVTARWRARAAGLTLAAGRKARKVAGRCGPGTFRSASRPLLSPCPVPLSGPRRPAAAVVLPFTSAGRC